MKIPKFQPKMHAFSTTTTTTHPPTHQINVVVRRVGKFQTRTKVRRATQTFRGFWWKGILTSAKLYGNWITKKKNNPRFLVNHRQVNFVIEYKLTKSRNQVIFVRIIVFLIYPVVLFFGPREKQKFHPQKSSNKCPLNFIKTVSFRKKITRNPISATEVRNLKRVLEIEI